MTATEIMREFHALDEKGRRAALADTTKGLGKEIAENQSAQAAIAADFNDGKLKETKPLSLDEQVAAKLPSHPFRSGASLPEGVKLDVLGKAHEIPAPVVAPDTSHPPITQAPATSVQPLAKPIPEVGDKVTVAGKRGTISKVENGIATEITFADGSTTHTEKADVSYEFVDPAKAKADV